RPEPAVAHVVVGHAGPAGLDRPEAVEDVEPGRVRGEAHDLLPAVAVEVRDRGRRLVIVPARGEIAARGTGPIGIDGGAPVRMPQVEVVPAGDDVDRIAGIDVVERDRSANL